MSKTIVVGVIVLFIGMGIQPAIATVEPKTSDSDDDCNLCPKKVSKHHLDLINRLINRIEKNDAKLSTLSKQYPEFEEKYQEISEEIATLKEINQKLKYEPGNFNKTDFWNLFYLLLFVLDAPLILYIIWLLDYDDYSNLKLLLLPFVILISIPGIILTLTWWSIYYPGPWE